MEVLHLTSSVGFGGAENHLADLVEGQIRRGYRVTVAYIKMATANGPHDYLRRLERHGAKTIDLSNGKIPFITLRRVVKELQPDILHSHLPRSDATAWIMDGLFKSKAKWICSLHNVYPQMSRGTLNRMVWSKVYKSPDGVIAISPAVHDFLRQDLRVSTKQIETVPYGVDPDMSAAEPARKPKGEKTIGTIARLTEQKNLGTLLRALARIPDARLQIVGVDAGQGPALKEMCRKLSITERVEFLGFSQHPWRELAEIDVFCLPSRWEGLGLVLLEAGLAKVPIVASDILPINWIAEQEKHAVLVPPDDAEGFASALRNILDGSDAGIGARTEAFHKRVTTRFSHDAMIDRTLAIYYAEQ